MPDRVSEPAEWFVSQKKQLNRVRQASMQSGGSHYEDKDNKNTLTIGNPYSERAEDIYGYGQLPIGTAG